MHSVGTTAVQVWVSLNGGAGSLFGSSGAGTYNEDAPWIYPNNTYLFTLYDYSSGTRGATLAMETVTGGYSVSLNFSNVTRSLGTNFVVGDTWSLTVTGAPASTLITVYWTNQTGGSSGPYSPGYTDLDGSFSGTYSVVTGSVGRYSGQWYLGSATVGLSFNTEVILNPTSIYPHPGTTFDCPSDQPQPYGFGLDENYGIEGLTYGDVNIPITGESSYDGGYSDASAVLGSLPYFEDAAVIGACNQTPFTDFTFDETIDLIIGGGRTSMRTNHFSITSTSPHSGEISNGVDIDVVK